MTLVALAACVVDAWGSRERLAFLLPAVPYGVLLEQIVILRYERYVYSVDAFLLTVGDVPVVIGLGWAVILYGGWRVARSFGVRGLAVPAVAALFALHVDLTMDMVAIRVPYWQWTPAGVWFGVPVGNFLGWVSVAVLYTGAWTVANERFGYVSAAVAAPVAGVVLLLVPLSIWSRVEPFLADWMRFAFVFLLVGVLVVGAVRGQTVSVRPFPWVASVVAGLFHGWFLVLLVVYELWTVSVLVPVVGVLVALVPVAFAVAGR